MQHPIHVMPAAVASTTQRAATAFTSSAAASPWSAGEPARNRSCQKGESGGAQKTKPIVSSSARDTRTAGTRVLANAGRHDQVTGPGNVRRTHRCRMPLQRSLRLSTSCRSKPISPSTARRYDGPEHARTDTHRRDGDGSEHPRATVQHRTTVGSTQTHTATKRRRWAIVSVEDTSTPYTTPFNGLMNTCDTIGSEASFNGEHSKSGTQHRTVYHAGRKGLAVMSLTTMWHRRTVSWRGASS
jgi:hypothetical protein